MSKWLLALLFWFAVAISSASAQNVTCATRPTGDDSNACASTAFVQNTVSSIGGSLVVGTTPITNGTSGLCLYDNGGILGVQACGGGGGTTVIIDDLLAGTDYTPGTSTTVTLTASPSSTQFLSIYFDGVRQSANTWSLASDVVTFNAAIPSTVQVVEAQIGVIVGTPNVVTSGTLTANNLIIGAGGTSVADSDISLTNFQGQVTTEAALIALAPGIAPTLFLQGYYAYGDGGEGNFTWAASCPASTDAGVYIAPSTGGSGCWVRQTYSTQPNFRWWGAHCDWNGTSGTDDGPIIQKAINWANAVGGREVFAPGGCKMGITTLSKITTNNIGLSGQVGYAMSHNTGSASCSWELHANAGMTSTMMEVYPTATGAAAQVLSGDAVEKACFFGSGHAATGLLFASTRDSKYSQLYFEDFTSIPFYISVAPNLNGDLQLGDPCDTQFNDISNITINEFAQSGAAAGIYLQGYGNSTWPNGGCDVSLNHFASIDIEMNTQPGIVEAGADNNDFQTVRVFLSTTSSGSSLTFFDVSPGPNPYVTNSELFISLSGNGGVLAGRLNNAGNNSIQMLGLDNGNGVLAPSGVSGSHANWQFKNGTTGSF